MANGIRTGDPRGFNKGRSSKFREGSRVRQTPEEGRRIYGPKRCGNNSKDEDNSPKTLNDKERNEKNFNPPEGFCITFKISKVSTSLKRKKETKENKFLLQSYFREIPQRKIEVTTSFNSNSYTSLRRHYLLY